MKAELITQIKSIPLTSEERSVREAFQRRVADLREAKGLSKAELSRRCGLHNTFFCHMETGNKLPSIPVLCVIAEQLGTTAAELLKYPYT